MPPSLAIARTDTSAVSQPPSSQGERGFEYLENSSPATDKEAMPHDYPSMCEPIQSAELVDASRRQDRERKAQQSIALVTRVSASLAVGVDALRKAVKLVTKP